MFKIVRRWPKTVYSSLHRYHDTSSPSFQSQRDIATTTSAQLSKTRGGQNLSERYKRLERSLRGKDKGTGNEMRLTGKRSEGTRELKYEGSPRRRILKVSRDSLMRRRDKAEKGGECCMSGCAVCVYDLYEEAVEMWKVEVEGVKGRLREMGVDESEWPVGLQTRQRKNVVQDAFEQLERELADGGRRVD
ncbi:hypothetical protein F5887DRAFT_908947 [Amanita rubescens]|nr:hypothetical protein F5887DRAFT_908947 [Amanita rubescens]